MGLVGRDLRASPATASLDTASSDASRVGRVALTRGRARPVRFLALQRDEGVSSSGVGEGLPHRPAETPRGSGAYAGVTRVGRCAGGPLRCTPPFRERSASLRGTLRPHHPAESHTKRKRCSRAPAAMCARRHRAISTRCERVSVLRQQGKHACDRSGTAMARTGATDGIAAPDPSGVTGDQGGSMRIGIIAPPWLPVPPPAYGGTEEFIADLACELSSRGHEVILFCTGDSTCPVERRSLVAVRGIRQHRRHRD